MSKHYKKSSPCCDTWQRNNTERCAKGDDRVADVVEVEILDGASAEDDEEDDEDTAVEAMVEVGQGGRLHLHEAGGGQGGGQHHEQGHRAGDGGVLGAKHKHRWQAVESQAG